MTDSNFAHVRIGRSLNIEFIDWQHADIHLKLSSLQVLMYLGSTESIKLFLEHTDCLGIVSIRSITRELYSGQLRVVEIKGMPMLRDFSFAQPQGQESGLAQVFMQFAMHNNNKL